MLSATADHAVRAVLALARASAGGRRQLRADEIAVATGAPHNYLAKTLNALAKAGVVTSARGPAGGFTLAVTPESLTLARIVDLFDVPRPHSRCLLGNAACDPNDPCAAHACWTAVMRARREPLATTTIADLLAGSTTLTNGMTTMPNTETPNTAAPAIDPTWSVNEILRRYPAAVTVLSAYGIDSCCGGPRAIADVARAHRLDLPALLAELTELTAA